MGTHMQRDMSLQLLLLCLLRPTSKHLHTGKDQNQDHN
jgi:hypothetical protein